MLYGMAANKADVITTVSNYSSRSIEKFLGVPPGKTTIVPNAVDDRYFQSYDKEKALGFVGTRYGLKKYILYVSRFEPRKNHVGLLRAFVDLKLYSKGYSLVLVGHRSLAVKGFDELLNSLTAEIRRSILVIDDLADSDLLELYRAATLFVYPSRAEGFGIPPLEAAALQIPVICSNASAMQDFSELGITLINTSDQQELNEAISQMLIKPPSADTLQKIADNIRSSFTWERSAETFYQHLLKEKTLPFNSKYVTNDKLPVS